MLRNIIHQLDVSKWADICNKCYHLKYHQFGIVDLPYDISSNIRGFTGTGILYQCCFYSNDCTDEDLNQKLENTLIEGINELIKNGKKLKELGINLVKEWHLIVPEYRDRRILECCENERKKVQTFSLDYIDNNFKIYIKTEEDFYEEIDKVISSDDKYKLELSYTHSNDVNLDDFPSEKVENIRRKLKAIIGKDITNETEYMRYDRAVKMYISYYNQGIIILNKLREDCPQIYEKIKKTENSYKLEASTMCDMNFDAKINKDIFTDILREFGNRLNESFEKILTTESINELKNDLVSGWLADCPMDFYM